MTNRRRRSLNGERRRRI